MRKARIILSSIAVFAVIGGAFAFKASKTPPFKFFTSYLSGSVVRCSLNTLITTTDVGANTTVYEATLSGNICNVPSITKTTAGIIE